jgi:hypothetical protein
MTTIATYVHAQDSLVTTKIKQICFLFFLKRILVDRQVGPIKENHRFTKLFWGGFG